MVWKLDKTQEYQDCVFLCFPARWVPSFLLTPIIWAPDPQVRRRRNSSVSLPGNVSYCKEILEVFLLTMFSTSALGYLLLPPVDGSLPFNTVWIRSVPTPLLFFILMFLAFSISSLLHQVFFFHYLSSSIFPVWSISSFRDKSNFSDLEFSFLLSRHMEKIFPQTNVFLKMSRKTCRKSLIKMSLVYNCLQTNHFTKLSQWIMSFSITILWSLPQ